MLTLEDAKVQSSANLLMKNEGNRDMNNLQLLWNPLGASCKSPGSLINTHVQMPSDRGTKRVWSNELKINLV